MIWLLNMTLKVNSGYMCLEYDFDKNENTYQETLTYVL